MGLLGKRGRISEHWNTEAGSNLLAGPHMYDVDSDGNKEIVIGTQDGRIIMIGHDSAVKWTFNAAGSTDTVDEFFQDTEHADSIQDVPVIADIDGDGQNEVAFGTEEGSLYVLDNQGAVKMKHSFPDAIRCSPSIYNGTLMVSCMNGSIYQLGSDGSVIWHYETGSSVETTPANIPGTDEFIIGCHDGTIRCISLSQGERWKHKTDAKIVANPVVADLEHKEIYTIIIGSTDYSLYALATDGDIRWTFRTQGAIIAEAATGDLDHERKQEIVFGSCDNTIYALKHDGDLLWSYETYFWIGSKPVIHDIDNDGHNEVIIGSYDHSLYVLDSEGEYALDYVPGLGGVLHQAGHYTSLITKEPGRNTAKKIWQYQTSGVIVGTSCGDNHVVVNVKQGVVHDLMHQK